MRSNYKQGDKVSGQVTALGMEVIDISTARQWQVVSMQLTGPQDGDALKMIVPRQGILPGDRIEGVIAPLNSISDKLRTHAHLPFDTLSQVKVSGSAPQIPARGGVTPHHLGHSQNFIPGG